MLEEEDKKKLGGEKCSFRGVTTGEKGEKLVWQVQNGSPIPEANRDFPQVQFRGDRKKKDGPAALEVTQLQILSGVSHPGTLSSLTG